MSDQQFGPARPVASVLVVADDPNIASLCGELIAFAGHCPRHDFTDGVAGESIRRVRPDLVMIDGALDCAVVDACVEACDEVQARPVLTSSTGSEAELIGQAQVRGCIPFPLPGRPQSLGDILDRALGTKMKPPAMLVTWRPHKTIHPAFCAAIAGMARARALVARSQVVRIDGPRGRGAHDALEEVRRMREALRAAVRDYAAQLRRENVPEDRMLDLVRRTLTECATIVGEESAVAPIEKESRDWALEAYQAA